MKKTFTLLAAMTLSVVLYAFPNESRLSISATGNADIRVMVDGSNYRSNYNTVMINNLKSGYHSVKVYRYKNGRGDKPGAGYQNNRYELIYSSNIYVKPQYHLDIFINRFGKAFIDEQFISGRYTEETDDWSYDNETGHQGNNTMSAGSFEQLKKTLSNESFDNTRLIIARQVITDNYFTVAQVKEMVGLFSFDNSKLNLAKAAYKKTIDKGNYFMINDAFSFSSSKDELIKYIQNNK